MNSLTRHQQQRLDQLFELTPAQREAICKQCGVCCLHKIQVFDKTVFLDLCCEYLNPRTRKCNVYDNRTSVCELCRLITPDIIKEGRLLPASCGYMEYVFGPAPVRSRINFSRIKPVTDAQLDKIAADYDKLFQHIIEKSVNWNVR